MRVKRVFFTTAIAGIAYLAIEFLALGIYVVLFGKMFSFSEINEYRSTVIEQSRTDNRYFADFANDSYLTLHPFLGFVYNPRFYENDPLMTDYGFRGEVDPLVASRDPNIAIIGLTGGSVSEKMFRHSRNILHEKLSTLPQFQNRKLAIIMLGREVYNQPQQLIAVIYYLMQGGRLDILVNLDGFNEVRNGYMNHQQGVYTAYPQAYIWKQMFATAQIPDSSLKLGKVMLWKQIRYVIANASRHVSYSISLSSFWRILDIYIQHCMVNAEKKLTVSTEKIEPYFIVGPKVQQNMSSDEVAEEIANMWERSSLQLNYLARANGFRYYHFLQPNQYLKDSKPLNLEEKSNAYNPEGEDARGVFIGYPKLMARVPSLRKHGVDIHDLTDIFRNSTETIYEDSCCHVNQRGNDMLAEALGDYIAAHPQH